MKITISRGATVNLGNYESARIDVSVETDFDALETADKWLCTWLENEILKIQMEAGLPPNPPSRFTGRTEN